VPHAQEAAFLLQRRLALGDRRARRLESAQGFREALELDFELGGARPAADGALRERTAAREQAGGVREVAFESDEAPRGMLLRQRERGFEIRGHVDVADEDFGQALAPGCAADVVEEPRHGRTRRARARWRRAEPGSEQETDLPALARLEPGRHAPGRLEIARDEGPSARGERRVQRSRVERVRAQVVRDESEELLRQAGTGVGPGAFDDDARGFRELLEVALAVEQELDPRRELGALDVARGALGVEALRGLRDFLEVALELTPRFVALHARLFRGARLDLQHTGLRGERRPRLERRVEPRLRPLRARPRELVRLGERARAVL